MKLNKIMFPAPKSSYDSNSLLGEIVYIPRNSLTKDFEPQNSVGGMYGSNGNGKRTVQFSQMISSNKN